MSLIWMDGFDSYGPVADPDTLYNDDPTNQLLLSSGYVYCNGVGLGTDTRVGYGKSLWTTANSFGVPTDFRLAFVPKDQVIVGFAFKYHSTELANIMRFMFDDRLGNVTSQMRVYANAEGGISLSIDGTTLLYSSAPNIIFPNVWQYIEMKYTPNKETGQIIIKVDGQTCIQFDGPTSPQTTPNQVNMLQIITLAGEWDLASSDPLVGIKHYDDLYVLDNLGSGMNDFLGDVIVHSVNVVGDQGPNQMQQFGGEADHYTAVDDWPPDDDVSYLYTNTAGEQEMFNLDTLPDNIIDVLAVSVHIRGKKDAPGQSAVQCVAKFDTNEVTGAAQPLAVQYVTKNLFLEQCPDGTAWTKEKAEATKIGFKSA
jgi:hypothetical protein